MTEIPRLQGDFKCPWAKFSALLIKYFLSSNGEKDILLTFTVWSDVSCFKFALRYVTFSFCQTDMFLPQSHSYAYLSVCLYTDQRS